MAFSVKDILKMEVAPALGCTEPVAIALGAAAAVGLLPSREVEKLDIWVDPNIYKNGMAVAIPGTGGLSGLDTASAVGAFGGDAQRGLEVLASVDASAVSRARDLIERGGVDVHLLEDHQGLYIRTQARSGKNVAESVIEKLHDNIAFLSLNGQPADVGSEGKPPDDGARNRLEALESWLKSLALTELIDLIDGLDEEDYAFLEEGVSTNMRLADYGLKHGSGLGIGMAFERLVRQRLICRDMVLAARILASGAADARMAGINLPAMSSAGSGNHGLTAILPIRAVWDFVDCSKETFLKAIALSHILTGTIKAHTGRLSAVCGCSVAAGAGAAAGVTYLLGGSTRHISGAICNHIEDLAGVICDGAKAGCSIKLATAAGSAVRAALFSLQGVYVAPTDGIVGLSAEKTLENVGLLSTQGMIDTDRTILRIMLEKRFRPQ
ncbi:MAG: L-serine ammonia-lyase, iron-sulfur-dependent, subunit alpha [Desulfobacterales bacterium]|jgi:L-cysteine desulfidase